MASQDAFERLDIDRPDSDPVQLRLHTARYEFARQWAREKRVLDIACGTGYGTAVLARAGARAVLGIDLDRNTIERARSQFNLPAVSFTVGDAEAPQVAGPFDLIVSFETIEHLPRPERFLSSMNRLLAADGTFLVSTPCRESGSVDDRPQNPFHVREWNQAEFTQMVERSFRRVTMHGQLIEFAKNRLPLNRTLARLVTSVLAPTRLRNMHSFDVLPLEGLPLSRRRISYLVAVCREPDK
jgi:SAM-dependent methyltransferase